MALFLLLTSLLLPQCVIAEITFDDLSESFELNRNWYFVSKDTATVYSARTNCESLGLEFAFFSDNSEFSEVSEYFHNSGYDEVWVESQFREGPDGGLIFSWRNEDFDPGIWSDGGPDSPACSWVLDWFNVGCCTFMDLSESSSAVIDDEWCSYSFHYMCKDINQCDLGTHACQHVCENRYINAHQCACRAGYSLDVVDGKSCNDVDECADTINPVCQHTCDNTEGTFSCSCLNGFDLAQDNTSCVNINECEQNPCASINPCAQICVDNEGSFTCSCAEGYVLGLDGKSCDNIDECDTTQNNCEHTCNDTLGSYMCICNSGYLLLSDGNSCENIDECSHHPTPCSHTCEDTDGSFICACPSGYMLKDNMVVCQNIDECSSDNECSQLCTDTEGSYECSCQPEHQLQADMITCLQVDVCEDSLCQHYCVGDGGSFKCLCNEGYTIADDGRACLDINECGTGQHECDQVCTNADGTYSCSCREGFFLIQDGRGCDNENECDQVRSPCTYECTDTVGSFTCSCPFGYHLTPDLRDCENTHECATGAHNCSQECLDVEGTYDCSCLNGFELDTDLVTCVNVNECSRDPKPCPHDCEDTEGSFACSCFSGYMRDPNSNTETCINISHVCTDTTGRSVCLCPGGYELVEDGRICVNIDECALGQDTCDQLCLDTEGSFDCSCRAGFDLMPDCRSCSKERVCLDKGCAHNCIITSNGSAECVCRSGYSLNNTNRVSCNDIDECAMSNNVCEVSSGIDCINTEGSYRCGCPYDHIQVNSSCVRKTKNTSSPLPQPRIKVRPLVCPCGCSKTTVNLKPSEKQVEEITTAIERELKVDVQDTSSHIRSKTSAPDSRKSAEVTGHVALAFMCFVLVLVVIPDVISLMAVLKAGDKE